MKKQLAFILGLMIVAGLASCGGAAAPMRSEVQAVPTAAAAKPQQPAGGVKQVSDEEYARQLATFGKTDVDPQTGLNRMVIYNANLDLIVADTLKAMEEVRKIIQTAGGYIASSNSYRQDEQLRANITARVPAEKLNETLDLLKKAALTVDREGLKGEDVTDQYTDLEARLRNMEASEKQYLEILKKADKIEDVLAVQHRLDDIRGQIEQTKGRMEYLAKSAALATIQITLIPDALARPIAIGGWRPAGTARDAFEALLWALKTIGDILIWTTICVLPVGVLFGVPAFFAARWGLRRIRKPKPQSPAPSK
jgi:hypothetical protein